MSFLGNWLLVTDAVEFGTTTTVDLLYKSLQ